MIRRTRFPVAFLWTLGPLFLAGGCATSRPIHYYTLAPPDSPAREKPDGPTMLVANIEAPEYLQDARIHYRTGAHEAGAYELHRWTERPGTLIRGSLVNALRASGRYRRVIEASSWAAGDYLVRGEVHEFGEVDHPAIATRISVHLELIDQKDNREVWDRNYEREEPSSGKTIDDVVESMDRNLRQVAQSAATDIGAFVGTIK